MEYQGNDSVKEIQERRTTDIWLELSEDSRNRELTSSKLMTSAICSPDKHLMAELTKRKTIYTQR